MVKDAYELPRWTKTDILHTTTGIPYFRILLLQEAVAKIKRWPGWVQIVTDRDGENAAPTKTRLFDGGNESYVLPRDSKPVAGNDRLGGGYQGVG